MGCLLYTDGSRIITERQSNNQTVVVPFGHNNGSLPVVSGWFGRWARCSRAGLWLRENARPSRPPARPRRRHSCHPPDGLARERNPPNGNPRRDSLSANTRPFRGRARPGSDRDRRAYFRLSAGGRLDRAGASPFHHAGRPNHAPSSWPKIPVRKVSTNSPSLRHTGSCLRVLAGARAPGVDDPTGRVCRPDQSRSAPRVCAGNVLVLSRSSCRFFQSGFPLPSSPRRTAWDEGSLSPPCTLSAPVEWGQRKRRPLPAPPKREVNRNRGSHEGSASLEKIAW